MKKTPIVVTGSNGQLGKELQQLTNNYAQFEFHFLGRDTMPIDHFETVKNVLQKIQPHYLINCAAYTAVDKAENDKDAAFRINAEAVGILAEVCKKHNIKFIHISTDYVFDGTKSDAYQEDDNTNPLGVYGMSKLRGEQLATEKNPDSLILRTSWVYSSYGNNFVKTMIRLMKEKTTLNVVSDQIGSPTYAADLAQAILTIIANHQQTAANWHPGIFHYSNEATISWYDFAVAIKEIIGSSCVVHPIPTSAYPTPVKRPLFSLMDKRKFVSTFNIPLKPWKVSLKDCIKLL